ncbi:MAG: hypothetical protein ACRD82_01275 [Blastocatellia bacterium]
MTKRNLISLFTMLALIFSSVAPLYAQDGRQISNDRTPINRQSGQRTVVTQRSAGQLRAEMSAACDEAEATFNLMANYSIAQDGVQKNGYKNISGVLEQIANLRKQIGAIPDSDLQTMSNSFPDSETLERLTLTLRKMRSDPGFLSSLENAEKWFNSEARTSSRPGASKSVTSSSTSSPAFTNTLCNFSNLTDFPSAYDIYLTQLVQHVVNVILLFLDPSLGNNVPNPAYYIAFAAKAIVSAVLLGLDGARDAGLWCQDLATNMQFALVTDSLTYVNFMLPDNIGSFADYLKEFVTAMIQKAMQNGIPTHCALTRLAEADVFYNAGNWGNAYKKYRTAYQNIAAEECLQ